MPPNRTLTLLPVAISGALVLLTACGGGSDSTPTPSPTVRATIDPNATVTARPTRTPAGSSAPDVCSLISPASVVTLIGALSGTTSPDSGQCDYTGADGQLTVQLETEPTVAATQKVDAFSSGAEAVSAGDAAFFSGGQVVARKGLYVLVLTTTVQKDNLKDTLVGLAQSAAASLPAS
jgi:hypothetical protein